MFPQRLKYAPGYSNSFGHKPNYVCVLPAVHLRVAGNSYHTQRFCFADIYSHSHAG